MKSGGFRTGLFSAEAIEIGGVKCVTIVITDITEQQKAEEALANEAIRRRILIEQSKDGIVIIDQDGKVQEANQSFADMLGYSLDEVKQLNVFDWEFLHTKERTIEMVRSVDEKGNHFESQHRRKDGTIFDVEISCNGAMFAGQKLVFCVCRDITERKLSEKIMRESEERFRTLFETMAQGVIYHDSEGKVTSANRAAQRILGLKLNELIGETSLNPERKRLHEDGTPLTSEEHPPVVALRTGKPVNNAIIAVYNPVENDYRWIICEAIPQFREGEKQPYGVYTTFTDITERKRIEQSLRESEEKFSRAFQASPSSMSISRMSDGKIIEVNNSFLRDKGYTREEVIGRTSSELKLYLSEEDNNKMTSALKNQVSYANVEREYRTKSGEIRTGLMSAEVINIGNEPCMLVINTDITQQKKAQEQLRLLSSVTQQVTDSTVITDPELNITYINKAAEKMFGYTLDEVKGKKLTFLNKTQPNKFMENAFYETLRSGKVYTSTITKKRKDGSLLLCDCRLSPLVDENGKIHSLIDVQRDITKENEVENKLQEHKKLIDNILATTPEGVLVIDDKQHVILANKALYKIFRLNSRSLQNNLFNDIFPKDEYDNLHKAIKLGAKEKSSLEFRYQAHNQAKIIDCIIVKMDNDCVLLTFSDISRDREEEEKLYLTSRLASIGEMAAGLAHELNNPLTGILTLSQLLANSDLPAENKEDIDCIYTEAKRAAGIVKNVLLFARNRIGDSGQSQPNEVIKDVFRLREYEQKSNNIKVSMNLEDNLPEILLDKGQLQQVFMNLISNAEAAIKETKRPGIINVTTQRENNHVNIIFRDNGSGIKKQIIHRIFDPFFSTKEIGKGTGLGLSICYSIIVKHGGKINVESQVNEGTAFTIKMPVAM
jgi:two-component system NtrC family sensor kinase